VIQNQRPNEPVTLRQRHVVIASNPHTHQLDSEPTTIHARTSRLNKKQDCVKAAILC
jgi:hypothetical protein